MQPFFRLVSLQIQIPLAEDMRIHVCKEGLTKVSKNEMIFDHRDVQHQTAVQETSEPIPTDNSNT